MGKMKRHLILSLLFFDVMHANFSLVDEGGDVCSMKPSYDGPFIAASLV